MHIRFDTVIDSRYVCLIFVVIELLFAAFIALYIIINKNTMKSAKRKVFPKKIKGLTKLYHKFPSPYKVREFL